MRSGLVSSRDAPHVTPHLDWVAAWHRRLHRPRPQRARALAACGPPGANVRLTTQGQLQNQTPAPPWIRAARSHAQCAPRGVRFEPAQPHSHSVEARQCHAADFIGAPLARQKHSLEMPLTQPTVNPLAFFRQQRGRAYNGAFPHCTPLLFHLQTRRA